MRQSFRAITINATGPAMRRTFVVLCLGTAIMFVFTGLIAIYQAKNESASPAELREWTSRFSAGTLLRVIGMEVPLLVPSVQSNEVDSISGLFFQLLTSVNPEDPRSFLGRELPGFALFDGDFIVKGEGIDYTDAPIESPPPAPGTQPPELKDGTTTRNSDDNQSEKEDHTDASNRTTQGVDRVFIYHTHWYESFLPYLKTEEPNDAWHPEKNITKVGEQFAKELEKVGIGAKVSDKSYDYVEQRNYYTESGKTVKAAMTEHDSLQYFFDIHRDSQRKDKTTIEIEGKTYARVMFVIGEENENYEENAKLADKFHNQLEEMYPGLSRGTYTPGGSGVNGVYNQNLSPHALLIEMGGVDNKFEELNRSTKALAKAFSEIYWEAQPVDAEAP